MRSFPSPQADGVIGYRLCATRDELTSRQRKPTRNAAVLFGGKEDATVSCMRISIVAVGKWKAGPERELFDEYVRRLHWPTTLKEVEEHRKVPPAQLVAREGELLLAALPKASPGLVVVALDRRGKALSSEELANQIRQWRDRGADELAFLIGGADGLSAAVKQRAGFILSFGAMTWPHLLVRAMLAEQLYRAQSIQTGHPYHRA
jgi:23S rRNA (pseudouridine1915-N3)-methyltransferase